MLPNHSCKSYCVSGLCIGSEGDVLLCKPMPWSEYVIHFGSIEGLVGQLWQLWENSHGIRLRWVCVLLSILGQAIVDSGI